MRLSRILLLGVCPLALVIAPALAQSTGSEEIETVVVTGSKVKIGGVSSFDQVAKQMSSINQDFIETQTSGQTLFQNLNILPGFDFTNNDPYGTSGGNFRMHGQSGDHVSVTLDGMPLNDTGNYAMYTNQMIDPEVVGRISINQGTTDVDSPTAAVTGGSVAIRSKRPEDDFSVMTSVSGGDNSYQRFLVKVESGAIGPYGTKAYASYSYSDYDKFRGPGMLRKQQVNLDIYQTLGDLGWINLAAHFNRNRNNSYYSQYYGGSYGTGLMLSSWDDANDTSSTCTRVANGSGAQSYDSCSSYYGIRINPSDTGNIRFSSLWHLAPELTLTADASLQYVLANGGGTSTIYEHSAQMVGSTGTYSSTAYTDSDLGAYGCLSGANGGCDLNGDGDIRDNVRVYTPSETNTRRWGINTSLIYTPFEGHTFRIAYTLDYGVHRQTGRYSLINQANYQPYNVFSSDDAEHNVYAADGTAIRKRDRNSLAILNQASFDYTGDYFDGMVQAQIGFRLPYFERDLNQYCYTQIKTSTVLCTTQAPLVTNTNGTVAFSTSSTATQYIPPSSKTFSYNRFLPHIGFAFKPFGEEHQFIAAFTQEMAAPKTDSLYASTGAINSATSSVSYYEAFDKAGAETSTTYTLGYRFLGEGFDGSIMLWNTQVKNRLISSYDQEAGTSIYRSVPGVNNAGIDVDASYRILDNLSVYGSASYTSARIRTDVAMGTTTSGVYYAETGGKQMSEVPNWKFTGRVQYSPLPELKIGLWGKYVGRRFATDDNIDSRVPDYFVANADVTYDLDQVGMQGSSIRLNVDNIFDRHYYGSISSQTCYGAIVPGTTSTKCGSSAPGVYASPLRTISITLVAKY